MQVRELPLNCDDRTGLYIVESDRLIIGDEVYLSFEPYLEDGLVDERDNMVLIGATSEVTDEDCIVAP